MEKPKKTLRRALGDLGESIACQWYLDRDYELIDHNVNISRVGEIDLIVARVIESKIELIFVEVKTRSSELYGSGVQAVDYHKRQRMRNCAQSYLAEHRSDFHGFLSWRLDVVSIVMTNPPTISVYESIEV